MKKQKLMYERIKFKKVIIIKMIMKEKYILNIIKLCSCKRFLHLLTFKTPI